MKQIQDAVQAAAKGDAVRIECNSSLQRDQVQKMIDFNYGRIVDCSLIEVSFAAKTITL
jgi:hypothetical protein